MFRRLSSALLALSSGVFAHGKPFPHEHVGFLHLEDILLLGLALIATGSFALILYRYMRQKA